MALLVNPGSGGVPTVGDGWTNTVEEARREARHWLQTMHNGGMTEVELLPGETDTGEGRWVFQFRHTVTGTVVELETPGIDDLEAYRKQRIFYPRVYWNGSSSANPELEHFAAPGYRPLLTFVKADAL